MARRRCHREEDGDCIGRQEEEDEKEEEIVVVVIVVVNAVPFFFLFFSFLARIYGLEDLRNKRVPRCAIGRR